MVWLLKLKYGETIKLCLMDTDTYTVFIKTDGIYQNIAENVETRFDSSNYESDRPLPKGKNKKVIGLMKGESGGKIMIEFVGLKAKT